MGLRLLVCGGRDFTDRALLEDILDQLHAQNGGKNIGCVIEGGASGADALAMMWANTHGVCHIQMKANWDQFGAAAAGPIRNAWMLKYGLPDMVVAFPTAESKGTHDMIKRAKKAGLAVLIFEEETNETENA